jgi:ATP-dependent exoDNAse (exonuclease V) alpha subunit
MKFCFESKIWEYLFLSHPNMSLTYGEMIVLDKVFRQEGDSCFLEMLHEIRRGVVSVRTTSLLCNKVKDYARYANVDDMEDVNEFELGSQAAVIRAGMEIEMEKEKENSICQRPTKLFSRRKDVDESNKLELELLHDQEGRCFAAFDEMPEEIDKSTAKLYRRQMRFPPYVNLKVGAQVMLLKNIDVRAGLANGTRGVVVGFVPNFPGGHKRFPLIPKVNFGGVDRCVGEEKWEIYQNNRLACVYVFICSEYVYVYVTRFYWTTIYWSITCPTLTLFVYVYSCCASRYQIPLILAHAITIHKSQGSTIPKLELSFKGMFDYGQAYVALSRATRLDGILLSSFNASKIKAHPKVRGNSTYLYMYL